MSESETKAGNDGATDDDVNKAVEPTTSEEDKLQDVIDSIKDMKISELKMKLMSKGILTSTFCEKHEFVRAYAELLVKERNEEKEPQVSSANDDDHESDDDYDIDSNIMMDKLPEEVKRRVDVLKKMNDEREDLMKEYLKERAQLETKYHQLAQPLYEKRKNIIVGHVDVDDNERKGHQQEQSEGETTTEKGVPQFWVVAISQMPVTGELVSEEDVDCLGFLEDIRCIDYENGEGFTLEFHFAPNEYFHNSVLTKRYDVPNLLLGDEPILKNVEGCEIQWKSPEKTLTSKEITKQQRGKGKNAGQIRTITKNEKCDSFFHFFSPPKMPSLESIQNEEDAARLESLFDEDYDVAQAFRSHIVPKAVMWFAGDAMEKEMEAAMEGMEFPTGVAEGDENPECKQS
jgi:nucleosome assembly protein 1-like 1